MTKQTEVQNLLEMISTYPQEDLARLPESQDNLQAVDVAALLSEADLDSLAAGWELETFLFGDLELELA